MNYVPHMNDVWMKHTHSCMGQVSHVNESCPTYECVMSHIRMCHVPHMRESRPTHAWVMSYIWTSHVPRANESCHSMNESCPTYEWVMSHIWLSHVTRMNESYTSHEWVMSHTWMCHSNHTNESCHTYECVKSLIHAVYLCPPWIDHNTFSPLFDMRWLRLVGSLKVQVSFSKKPYKRDYILQKRPTILRCLLIVAIPYQCLLASSWNFDFKKRREGIDMGWLSCWI